MRTSEDQIQFKHTTITNTVTDTTDVMAELSRNYTNWSITVKS